MNSAGEEGGIRGRNGLRGAIKGYRIEINIKSTFHNVRMLPNASADFITSQYNML